VKRIAIAVVLAVCTFGLAGCPLNSSQQQQAAQASLQASTVLRVAQQGEIAAAKNGLIPIADDRFIQVQFENVALLGKTLDSCIKTASGNGAATVCLGAAITNVDQMNSNGGLFLKSATAKQDYLLAMTAIRTVFASIDATLGGTPPAAPVIAPAN
jgi:hypothetical protein